MPDTGIKVSFSDGLALLGIGLAIVLVVLDKAGKLRAGPVLFGLLTLAFLLTLPVAIGNSWVAEASGVTRFIRTLFALCVSATTFLSLAVWIAGPSPSSEVVESFAYLTPQPLDKNGAIRFAIRSVGKYSLNGVRVKVYDLQLLGDGSPDKELEIGTLPSDQLILVENFSLQPFPNPTVGHAYRFEIITDRGIFDQTMMFRMSEDKTGIEDRLFVMSARKLSEPMGWTKPLINQDWHSWQPKK